MVGGREQGDLTEESQPCETAYSQSNLEGPPPNPGTPGPRQPTRPCWVRPFPRLLTASFCKRIWFLLSFAEGSVSCCWHPYRPRSWSLRAGRDGSRLSGRTGLNVEAYLSRLYFSSYSSSPPAPFVAEKEERKKKKKRGWFPLLTLPSLKHQTLKTLHNQA